MAQSLVKLTLESNQYEKGLRNAQRQLNDFTKSIGLNMKSLSGMAIAAGAVTTAMKVMKDAFFKNEQQLDEWGRTVQSCDSLYSGFLNSLNNGDIGGFLGKIDQIVSAARRAYDAIDELATYNAFNRMNVSDARAGLSSAIADYRMGTGSKDAVKKANDELKAQLRERQKLERNAYEESVRDIAMQRGANPDDVLRLLGGKYVDFKNMKASYVGEGSFSGQTVKSLFGGATVAGAMSGVNFGTQVRKTPGTDEERLAVFARSLNDTELDKLQAMGEAANNTKREIADLDKQLARVLNGRGGAGGSGGGGRGVGSLPQTEMQLNQKKINDLITEYTNIAAGNVKWDDERLAKLREEISLLQQRNEKLAFLGEQAKGRFGGDRSFDTSYQGGIVPMETPDMSQPAQLNEKAMTAVIKQIKEATKPQEEEKKYLSEGLSQLSGGLGGIQSGLNQLGVELPEELTEVITGIQAVAAILTGISALVTIITAIQGAKATPVIGWLLARGGVVHAANGYTVPGNNFSGDMVPAMLNSGELVLNKAQQGNLASQLTGTGLNNLKLETYVDGRALRIVLNNESQGRMKGKYVTSTKVR